MIKLLTPPITAAVAVILIMAAVSATRCYQLCIGPWRGRQITIPLSELPVEVRYQYGLEDTNDKGESKTLLEYGFHWARLEPAISRGPFNPGPQIVLKDVETGRIIVTYIGYENRGVDIDARCAIRRVLK